MNSRALQMFGAATTLGFALLFSGCVASGPARASGPGYASSGAAAKKLSLSSPARAPSFWAPAPRGGAQMIPTQTTVQPPAPEATSAATAEAKSPESQSGTEAVSGATVEESAVKDAVYCLKCHGPFEKLAGRTKDYVTEFDEKANPHVYVRHDTKNIVECSECHDPHPIPYRAVEGARKPNVEYCYSCHHAQTLVNCNECHKE